MVRFLLELIQVPAPLAGLVVGAGHQLPLEQVEVDLLLLVLALFVHSRVPLETIKPLGFD